MPIRIILLAFALLFGGIINASAQQSQAETQMQLPVTSSCLDRNLHQAAMQAFNQGNTLRV